MFSKFRGVFRTLSNMYDGAFNYFLQKASSQNFDKVLNMTLGLKPRRTLPAVLSIFRKL